MSNKDVLTKDQLFQMFINKTFEDLYDYCVENELVDKDALTTTVTHKMFSIRVLDKSYIRVVITCRYKRITKAKLEDVNEDLNKSMYSIDTSLSGARDDECLLKFTEEKRDYRHEQDSFIYEIDPESLVYGV
jgi:hypothetical protein